MTGERIGISMNADMIDGSLERLGEHLSHIAGAGAGWAELILHGLDVVVNGGLDLSQVKKVRQVAARHPLRYTLHLPYLLNLLDREKKGIFTDVFRAGLRFASELEIPVVVYHASAAKLGKKDWETAWPSLLEEDAAGLARMADEAGPLGVSIGVENPFRRDIAESRSYGDSPEELAAHVARIGRKNLGITLDLGHLYLSSIQFGFDYVAAVQTLVTRAIHTHIHDNFGKMDCGEPYIHRLPYGLGDLHLPPGTGSIPLQPALAAVAAARYRGILMLEIEFRMYPRFPEHVAAARALFESCGM